jgi:hypothetical protein
MTSTNPEGKMMDTHDLQGLIARSYGDRDERQALAKVASAYLPNAEYARLLAIKATDVRRFEEILPRNPAYRMGLGYYQVAKAAHEALAELEGDQ